MNNTIYFGVVDPTKDSDYETCFLFNGCYYYYKLEWNDDFELRIVDTCNRFVPMHAGALQSFKHAFLDFYKMYGGKQACEMSNLIDTFYNTPVEQAVIY